MKQLCIHEPSSGPMDGWTDGWTYGGTEGGMDGWTDGRMQWNGTADKKKEHCQHTN